MTPNLTSPFTPGNLHAVSADEQVDDGLARAVPLDARQQVEQPGDDLEGEGVAAAEGAVLVEGAAGEEGVLEEVEDEGRLVAGRDVGEEGALAGEEGARGCAGGGGGGAQGEGFDVAHDEGEGGVEAGDEEGRRDIVEVGGVVCEEGRQVEDGAAACAGGVAGTGQEGDEVVAIDQGAFTGGEDDGAAGLEVGIGEPPESGVGRDEMRWELAVIGVTSVLVREGEGMSGIVVWGVAVIIDVDGRAAVFEAMTAVLKSGMVGVLRGQISVVRTHVDVLIDKLREA
ncbi:predicted protein [Verticillium alfalfae VaMs.102]|uniref:Predicted protein n=1 Tax=Verticillium alfalfae (strain VaMs.102 / ATCC MYA-4576 / FGSC 10136) TaxID=526221 RepID=C9SU08_VERA1|nr:predicted protein [Verticillium alfalfae VaMs.102]EEY22319.1 predicted protein [Verticillium alfalfae VaMs.102]